MALSKENALRLAANAMDMGAVALRGPLSVEEDGGYIVGDRDLSEWLNRYANQQIVVILAQWTQAPTIRSVYAACAGAITKARNVPIARMSAPGCEANPENKHPGRCAGVFSLVTIRLSQVKSSSSSSAVWRVR